MPKLPDFHHWKVVFNVKTNTFFLVNPEDPAERKKVYGLGRGETPYVRVNQYHVDLSAGQFMKICSFLNDNNAGWWEV